MQCAGKMNLRLNQDILLCEIIDEEQQILYAVSEYSVMIEQIM
jgi:hypothetical protein